MKLLLLLALCNPFAPIGHAVKAVGHGIAHVTSTAFYATTNFFVDHIQPNHKGEAGKVCH
jgi:hypothetical protein